MKHKIIGLSWESLFTPANENLLREAIYKGLSESNFPSLSYRNLLVLTVAELFFKSFDCLDFLDIASGHNFPILSWFQDNNAGPELAEAYSKKGASSVAFDLEHPPKFLQFKKFPMQRVSGTTDYLDQYFRCESFDLVSSVVFFGYPSSREGRRPDYYFEYKTMVAARKLTKQNGVGIHLLVDGYWQLSKEDLQEMGYKVIKY